MLFDSLPEPIDIDLDLAHRVMYWTDRGDPPRGNTVSRAPMDPHKGEQEILVSGLKEGIGISLDLRGGRMYYTDLGGNVYSARLDGSGWQYRYCCLGMWQHHGYYTGCNLKW